MSTYIPRRAWQALLVIIGVSAVSFFLIQMTGDPAALMLPMDASAADVAHFRESMGFNDPLYIQYGRFLGQVLQGNFGDSIRHNQPALEMVFERLPATAELTVVALLLSVLVAVPLGVITATRQHTLADGLGSVAGLLGQSMPTFWLGIMLIMVFSVQFKALPPSGRGGLEHLLLPAITLGTYSMATTMRLLRSKMLEVLGQDYIRTAQAKGLPQRVVIYRHALRNAMLPVITVIGLQVGAMLGGAVVTETIFAWPGIGRLAIQAINNRDIPLVQAVVFVAAATIVTVNLATDLLYGYYDPQIRFTE